MNENDLWWSANSTQVLVAALDRHGAMDAPDGTALDIVFDRIDAAENSSDQILKYLVTMASLCKTYSNGVPLTTANLLVSFGYYNGPDVETPIGRATTWTARFIAARADEDELAMATLFGVLNDETWPMVFRFMFGVTASVIRLERLRTR